MDNYPYSPFIDNSLLGRALPRPAAQTGAASSTALVRGLAAHASALCSFSRPQNHLAFDCRGDFRKDDAARRAEAFSYGMDNGFRLSPNYRLGSTVSGCRDTLAIEAQRASEECVSGAAEIVFLACASGSDAPSSSKFGQKPPIGRIEERIGGTIFGQVRAKTTHRRDRRAD